MAEQAKAKRKTTAKRKTAATKTTARKTTARSTARKTTAKQRRSAPKQSTVVSLQGRVSEASRKAFLASLGFYGMAFDEMQSRAKTVESELAARRKKADKLYSEMVKRGEKVEKLAKARIDNFDLPKIEFDDLTDRAKLEAQLEKARIRFAELAESVGIKRAA